MASKKIVSKKYRIDQSALYSIQSKSRLSEVLQISPSRMETLASATKNYIVFSVDQTDGSKKKVRKVQTPDFRLRPVHDRIFKLLSHIETPDYLHSGVKKRSYVTNASQHIGGKFLLKIDIEKFFQSTKRNHIKKLFQYRFKCSEDVSSILANICAVDARGISGGPGSHLPTGSPVSQIVAYLAHKDLFDSLNGVAEEEGLIFTCYVDDVNFSGPLIDQTLTERVYHLIRKADLRPNVDKTRLYRPQEDKLVTGVIVTSSGILVRNKSREKIRKQFKILENLSADTTPQEYLKSIKSLFGLINNSTSIDPSLKRYRKRAQKLTPPKRHSL